MRKGGRTGTRGAAAIPHRCDCGGGPAAAILPDAGGRDVVRRRGRGDVEFEEEMWKGGEGARGSAGRGSCANPRHTWLRVAYSPGSLRQKRRGPWGGEAAAAYAHAPCRSGEYPRVERGWLGRERGGGRVRREAHGGVRSGSCGRGRAPGMVLAPRPGGLVVGEAGSGLRQDGRFLIVIRCVASW